MLNPRTQHLTAVSTLCLTQIYQRLVLIRNVLQIIKSCLISAKTDSGWSSENCKELFSKYICQMISDGITWMTSGCSPFNLNSLLDTEEESSDFKGVLSATFSGVSEGTQTALGNFKEQYNTGNMDTLLGGGVGGVAQKACMAALGYDWGLDFNSVMDMAYTSSFASNVFTPSLRRSYLFYNPTTRQPVFEYKGGIFITPGCDMDSYTATLVCVTPAEKARYSNDIKCSGTVECPCLAATSLPSISISNPISSIQHNILSSSGKISQSVPVDKSFSVVIDNSKYVFDHLKIQLNIPNDKKKGCLPDGHEDGVFYYPISDMTTLNSIGCSASMDGSVVCSSKLSEDFLGFANIYVNDISVDNGIIGSTLNAQVRITKTGSEPACLYYEIYRGSSTTGTIIDSGQKDYTDVVTNFQVDLPLFKSKNIDASILGGLTQLAIKGVTIEEVMDGQTLTPNDKAKLESQTANPWTISGSVDGSSSESKNIYFRNTKGSKGTFSCGDGTQYSFSNSKTDL